MQYNGEWVSISKFLKLSGINYPTFISYLSRQGLQFNGIDARKALPGFLESRNKLKGKYDEQTILEIKKLRRLAKGYHISGDMISNGVRYLENNNISAEQVIVHFRPDLHINIFGRIVDENGNEV